MDGNQYLAMYAYLRGNTATYHVQFPFHSRILVPLIASWLPGDNPVKAFQGLNLLFSILSVAALFVYWQRLQINRVFMGLGFFWLLFHWTGLIRLNAYDPVTVDVPLYFIQIVFLLILWHKNWRQLWWFAPLATLQKESFPALLVILAAYGWLYNRHTKTKDFPLKIILGSLIVSAIAKYVVNYFFPPIESGSSVITILYFVKQSLLHPFRLVRWITGVWVAFGGLLVLAVQQWLRQGGFARLKDTIWTRTVSLPFFEDSHTDLLFLFSLTYLALSLLAGGDFTRIVFLGFPFIMTCCFLVLKTSNQALVFLALMVSIGQMNLGESIPDQGTNWDAFASWYPEFASWPVVLGMLAYGLVIWVSLWILHRQKVFP